MLVLFYVLYYVYKKKTFTYLIDDFVSRINL